MTNLAIQSDVRSLVKAEPQRLPFPGARVPISIRVAVPGDFKFIDQLQKKHSKMVGFMPTGQLETNIAGGHVLLAERAANTGGTPVPPEPVGYIIFNDKYFKREDCGVIYHLNVAPASHRRLIGAALVKAAFERSAYGVKLYCCWCAQDLEANRFWESIGFVPLAFRTGSERHGRIHIFWQKRIREGDAGAGATPFWFPSLTSGGAIREGRLVIPIPPGTHWSDAKPMIIPGVGQFADENEPRQLTGGAGGPRGASRGSSSRRKPKMTIEQKTISHRGGLWFAPSPPPPPPPPAPPPDAGHGKDKKVKGEAGDDIDGKGDGAERPRKRPARQYHPKYVEAARELCARYLEEVQAGRFVPELATDRKYDVSRPLEAGGTGVPPVLEGATGRMPVPPPVPTFKQAPTRNLLDAA